MTTANQIPWNLLTKNLHGHEQLREKIRQKIGKLERHLLHFPPDSVHLQIALEKHTRKALFMARLTLRLPSNILHSDKAAVDLIQAFDDSFRALLREIESLKADLRHEGAWKHKSRRALLHRGKGSRFAMEPLPDHAGPQKPEDLIRDLFQEHYPRLLRHASRHLQHDEAVGEIPKGALEPQEVVDETARRAINQGQRKPPELNWLSWFYRLVSEELRRQRRRFKQQNQEEVSLEGSRLTPGLEAENVSAERFLENTNEAMAVFDANTQDQISDDHAESPDRTLERKDMLEHLQHAIQKWPRVEREVFELYFVEGFEPDEIGMIIGQPLDKAQETIEILQGHLRQEMLNQAWV